MGSTSNFKHAKRPDLAPINRLTAISGKQQVGLNLATATAEERVSDEIRMLSHGH